VVFGRKRGITTTGGHRSIKLDYTYTCKFSSLLSLLPDIMHLSSRVYVNKDDRRVASFRAFGCLRLLAQSTPSAFITLRTRTDTLDPSADFNKTFAAHMQCQNTSQLLQPAPADCDDQ
jgi:hypothetical protein